jgi:tripartite-type tricarboxylate transporter receptor subunit TctC
MTRWWRKQYWVAAVAAVAMLSGFALSGTAASAADYPKKKIELVVAFNPGGGSDTFGRAVAKFGEKYIGKPLFVTNRAGGAGAIGFTYGAKAKPDGYVLTLVVTTLTIAPHTTEGYPVNYKDFEPIALLAVVPSCLSVREDSEFKTLDDVIAYAKKNPGRMRLGTAGTGSPWHLAGGALGAAAGIEPSFVPYKGAGPAITALLGGHLDTVVTSAAEIYPHVQADKARTLAIIAEQPFAAMPNVPTTVSVGLDADVVAWRGLAAPKGTPKEIVDYLIDAMEKLSKDQEFLKFLEARGVSIQLVTGDAFEEWLAKKHNDYGKIAKAAGLTSK